MNETTKYLTVAEVADMLDVSPKTVYKYIKEKKLRAGKIGRSWKIQESDLEDYKERCFNIK